MSDVEEEVEVEELFALFGVGRSLVVVIFSPFGDAWLFWAAHTTDGRRDSDETAGETAEKGRQEAVDGEDDGDGGDGDGPLLRSVYRLSVEGLPGSLRIYNQGHKTPKDRTIASAN